jgi:glycosyltransferase involved in cell wall biosynthesis
MTGESRGRTGADACVIMVGPARSVRGGVSAVVNALLAAMPDDAPDIRYVPTHIDGPRIAKALAALVGFVRLFLAFRFGDCEVVHLHMASYASFARKSKVASLAALFRKKVIIHVHGAHFHIFFDEASVNRKRAISWALQSADLVIALSEEWKERLHRISPEANIRILANPVDTRSYEGMVDARPEVPARGGTVLFLGAFTQRKGIYDLVEVIEKVSSERPEVVFELGGDREVSEVKGLIEAKGLVGNVRFMGWVRGEQKSSAFRRAHIFVLPSYNEGLPIAVLEAFAAGLPVVTTPVGGIPEIVDDGVNGILREPGDVDGLASSILRLLEDAELRRRLSAASLELVRTRHDSRVVARELVDWYNDVLTGAIRDDGAR